MPLLPGQVLSLRGDERNEMCEDHEDRPAIKKIVGETDSFGSEYRFACQECLDKHNVYRESIRDGVEGYCDWCKTQQSTIKPFRSIDEGHNGPVYDVCQSCRTKHIQYWSEQDD